MKKAFLVSFSPMTRVVVDVPDDFLEDEFTLMDDMTRAKVIRSARERMIENGIDEYLNGDNIDTIELDEEMPYEEGE